MLANDRSAVRRAISVLLFVTASASADEPPYASLEAFCLATKVDTPANCKCGQATADRLMSAEEQALVLSMMLDRALMAKVASEDPVLIAKFSQVTQGCQL